MFIFSLIYFLVITEDSYAQRSYSVDNITVGECKLSVYIAKNFLEKASGMLGYNEKNFKQDGMLFLGEAKKTHYYHTVGMLIPIYIVGVDKVNEKTYVVNGNAKYAPIGLDEVQIYGQSVLELPVHSYNLLKECLYK